MTNAMESPRPDIPPSTLGNRLRDSREWRGLEQAQMAEELGIGRSTVSNYERGITPATKLVINAWAVVCQVDVEWLKTGDIPGWAPRGSNPRPTD
jgi:transcriptional regulator with XRE-family HTH domain